MRSDINVHWKGLSPRSLRATHTVNRLHSLPRRLLFASIAHGVPTGKEQGSHFKKLMSRLHLTWFWGCLCEGERLSFSSYRRDNWGLGEWTGQKIEAGPQLGTTSTLVLAGLVSPGCLLMPAILLTRWRVHIGVRCLPQQFSAWINCPQPESPNGNDTVFRFEELRDPSRGNSFRTSSHADLKKSAGKQPRMINDLFFLTGERSARSREISL